MTVDTEGGDHPASLLEPRNMSCQTIYTSAPLSLSLPPFSTFLKHRHSLNTRERISLLPNAKPGHETNHLAASFARREGTEGFFVVGHPHTNHASMKTWRFSGTTHLRRPPPDASCGACRSRKRERSSGGTDRACKQNNNKRARGCNCCRRHPVNVNASALFFRRPLLLF